jgi:hypothetical protein
MKLNIQQEQKNICLKYKAEFYESRMDLKVGISENVMEGMTPVTGLRITPEGDTTGWYIWAGEEFSSDSNFFVPVHVEHIDRLIPSINKYLGLAPGWRFLIAGDYVDVWYDSELLVK